MTDKLEKLEPKQIIRLNWEILPPGEYPWSKVKDYIAKYTKCGSKTEKRMLLDRSEFINEFNPDIHVLGKSGFSGYIVYGFKEIELYILESVYINNATYVFGSNWLELSQLSKAEILSGGFQLDRIIHNEKWKDKIKNLLNEGSIK